MSVIKYILLVVLYSLIGQNVYGQFTEKQHHQIDSLNTVINSPTSHDTSVVDAYVGLSEILYVSNLDTLKYLCEKAKIIAETALSTNPPIQTTRALKISLASAIGNIGYVYQSKGEISLSLKYFNKALKLQEELGNKKGMASSCNNIGMILSNQGDVALALEYLHKSLKLREEIGNKKGMAVSYNNIGFVHANQEDVDIAVEYYDKSLKLYEDLGNKSGMATAYINIGMIYSNQDNVVLALEYYNKSLKIREEMEDKYGMAYSYNNIGACHSKQGDFTLALEYLKEGLRLREELGNKKGVATSLASLGRLYLQEGKALGMSKSAALATAKEHGEKGLELAQEIGFPDQIGRNAGLLSKIAIEQNNFKEALKMRNLEILMKDSITTEKAVKASAQQEIKYKYEKQKAIDDVEHEKQKAIDDKEHENRLAIEQEEKARQQIMTYSIGGGLVLVIVFLGFVFNRLKITRKQNIIIEQAHEQLAEHHKEIQDSINYAKRIQEAIMPSMEAMNQALKNGFILYEPKDVVAGDFFWMEQQGDVVYFAAADCTGHGVPGAMVSVVCSNALNKALLEEQITHVGELLDRTREIVIDRLAKGGEEVKDGMDISLCALNTKSNELKWAGANNPLWILRKGAKALEETKPNKQPIGKYANEHPFTEHTIQLNEADAIYIFTDGYQDQFGGPKGKKFKTKQLKQILLNNKLNSMQDQKEELIKAFHNWKSDLEQVDDVCIIGVRI